MIMTKHSSKKKRPVKATTRTSTVELDGRQYAPWGCLRVGGFSGIKRVNVRPMLLVVMKLHGLLRDTRLEGVVVVGKSR
jgi:hypothetical protein